MVFEVFLGLSEAMCGFTFVVCMYQVILFDLFGQHCSRMRGLAQFICGPMRFSRHWGIDDVTKTGPGMSRTMGLTSNSFPL